MTELINFLELYSTNLLSIQILLEQLKIKRIKGISLYLMFFNKINLIQTNSESYLTKLKNNKVICHHI